MLMDEMLLVLHDHIPYIFLAFSRTCTITYNGVRRSGAPERNAVGEPSPLAASFLSVGRL
jgi:hypothetical protein